MNKLLYGRSKIIILILLLAVIALITSAVLAEDNKDKKPAVPQPVHTEEELPASMEDTDKEETVEEIPYEGLPLPEDVVSEKPKLVTAVVIEGNNAIPADEIKNVLITKTGDPVLEPKLIRDRRAILDMGYFSDVNYSEVPFDDGVKVVFTVLENPIVKEIEITGNKIVTTDKLLALMETKIGKILNNKVLSGDLAVIRNYYNEDLGYWLPNHIKDIIWTPEGEIKIDIREAMMITEVNITGNKTYSEEKLKKIINLKPGELFNKKVLSKDLTNLLDFYKEKDYFANIQQPQIDYDKGIVNIDVAEVTVEKVEVTGNVKTKTYFIMRILKMKQGMFLRSESIMRDHRHLQDLQLFDNIEIETEQGSAPDKYIVIWKVKEPKKYNFFTFGVGYGGGGVSATSRSGLTGGVTANMRNLGGNGQSISTSWQRGFNIDSWAVSYYSPAINKRADQIGFSVFNSTYRELRQPIYDTEPVLYSYYDDHRGGGTVSYGRWLGLDLRGIIGLRRETIAMNKSAASEYTPIAMGSGSLNAVSLTGIYDTRDDVFNPYKGYYINTSGMVAGNSLKGSYNFSKYQAEIRRYFPLKKERSIALRLWGGAISGIPPAMEYFYIGGVDTLRAYEDNSIFGSRMLLANAEYRFPVGKIDLLKAAVFADAGNAWSPGQDSTLRKDVGVGLRLVFQKIGLAVGVIRIDYAVRGGGKGRFSIGMGQSF
ncbi:MAG: POTRA domain-containing protein [Armatimonadota bacterium]